MSRILKRSASEGHVRKTGIKTAEKPSANVSPAVPRSGVDRRNIDKQHSQKSLLRLFSKRSKAEAAEVALNESNNDNNNNNNNNNNDDDNNNNNNNGDALHYSHVPTALTSLSSVRKEVRHHGKKKEKVAEIDDALADWLGGGHMSKKRAKKHWRKSVVPGKSNVKEHRSSPTSARLHSGGGGAALISESLSARDDAASSQQRPVRRRRVDDLGDGAEPVAASSSSASSLLGVGDDDESRASRPGSRMELLQAFDEGWFNVSDSSDLSTADDLTPRSLVQQWKHEYSRTPRLAQSTADAVDDVVVVDDDDDHSKRSAPMPVCLPPPLPSAIASSPSSTFEAQTTSIVTPHGIVENALSPRRSNHLRPSAAIDDQCGDISDAGFDNDSFFSLSDDDQL
jgi:hypothetical protein